MRLIVEDVKETMFSLEWEIGMCRRRCGNDILRKKIFTHCMCSPVLYSVIITIIITFWLCVRTETFSSHINWDLVQFNPNLLATALIVAAAVLILDFGFDCCLFFFFRSSFSMHAEEDLCDYCENSKRLIRIRHFTHSVGVPSLFLRLPWICAGFLLHLLLLLLLRTVTEELLNVVGCVCGYTWTKNKKLEREREIEKAIAC